MGCLSRRVLTGSGTSHSLDRERYGFRSTKLNGIGDMDNILTSDMEMQSLEFAQLVFSLALVLDFLAMIPSICFVMIINILCQLMLEECGVLFDFYFTGINVKRLS